MNAYLKIQKAMKNGEEKLPGSAFQRSAVRAVLTDPEMNRISIESKELNLSADAISKKYKLSEYRANTVRACSNHLKDFTMIGQESHPEKPVESHDEAVKIGLMYNLGTHDLNEVVGELKESYTTEEVFTIGSKLATLHAKKHNPKCGVVTFALLASKKFMDLEGNV